MYTHVCSNGWHYFPFLVLEFIYVVNMDICLYVCVCVFVHFCNFYGLFLENDIIVCSDFGHKFLFLFLFVLLLLCVIFTLFNR